MRLTMAAFVLAALTLMQGATAVAASGYTLFGDAEIVSGGNPGNAAQLRSDATPGYGGVDFNTPAGMTVNDLTNLSTDYKFTEASCGGGAPRFQINVDGVNISVYIGPPPSYTGCPMNAWLNTGNLVTPASLVDSSQLPGGTFYDTWAHVLFAYGTHAVTGIQLVTDSSWFFSYATQTMLADNVMINSTTYTFEPTSGAAQVQVTGGGQINGTTGKANFGFNVRQKGTIVSGHINYRNHRTGAELNCPVTTLSITGNSATFGNTDTAAGCNFSVTVQDNGNPGKGNDTFNITSSSTTPPESNSGTLTAGNIQVRSGP